MAGFTSPGGGFDPPAFGDVSVHKGDDVDVLSGDTQSVFSFADPVVLLSGTIGGEYINTITLTDGSGNDHNVMQSRSFPGDNFQSHHALPPIASVKSLSFKAGSGSRFGWEVWTR